MRDQLSVAVTAIAMLLVAVLAGLLSLRVAIHGREVSVPNLAGLSDSDAAAAARKLGLNLSVENRFYSASVAANHVLSQAPASGARVRRGWQVRVTESLGGQRVTAPDLTGESERPATLMLSRLQLELAPEARLPSPGSPGIVVAQSPPPGSSDVTGPRIALLVSGPGPDPSSLSYVMPRILGMSVAWASDFLSTAGLHIASAVEPGAASATPPAPGIAAASGGTPPSASPQEPGATTVPPVASPTPPVAAAGPPPIDPSAIIVTQSPPPGHRVTRADPIRVIVGHDAGPAL